MVLDEGKNREIRRMLARLGHKVHQLKRVAVGALSLGSLLPGEWRPLSWTEIESLRKDAEQAIGTPPRGPRRPGRPPRRGPPTGRGGPQKRPPAGQPGRKRRPGKASSWRKQ